METPEQADTKPTEPIPVEPKPEPIAAVKALKVPTAPKKQSRKRTNEQIAADKKAAKNRENDLIKSIEIIYRNGITKPVEIAGTLNKQGTKSIDGGTFNHQKLAKYLKPIKEKIAAEAKKQKQEPVKPTELLPIPAETNTMEKTKDELELDAIKIQAELLKKGIDKWNDEDKNEFSITKQYIKSRKTKTYEEFKTDKLGISKIDSEVEKVCQEIESIRASNKYSHESFKKAIARIQFSNKTIDNAIDAAKYGKVGATRIVYNSKSSKRVAAKIRELAKEMHIETGLEIAYKARSGTYDIKVGEGKIILNDKIKNDINNLAKGYLHDSDIQQLLVVKSKRAKHFETKIDYTK